MNKWLRYALIAVGVAVLIWWTAWFTTTCADDPRWWCFLG